MSFPDRSHTYLLDHVYSNISLWLAMKLHLLHMNSLLRSYKCSLVLTESNWIFSPDPEAFVHIRCST